MTGTTGAAGNPAAPDPDGYDIAWMTEQTTRIILAATDSDGPRAADAMAAIVDRYADRGMYGLCCALAEAFTRLSDYQPATGDEWYGVQVEHLDRGPIDPEDVEPDAADVMAAMRFVVAVLNRDSDQALALFYAPQTMEDASRIPLGLIKLVGAAGRHKLAEDGAR